MDLPNLLSLLVVDCEVGLRCPSEINFRGIQIARHGLSRDIEQMLYLGANRLGIEPQLCHFWRL